MSLNSYLESIGLNIHDIEGYSQQVSQQVEDLINIIMETSKINATQPLRVMEIGFNAGHSAEVFLNNSSNLLLTSFDLGYHRYVNYAKKYIDDTYPNRHTLILGNSVDTIPNFIRENPDIKFDVIFIDGGHQYEIAKADIENCYHLAHKDTIVLIDDTIFTEGWEKHYTVGPTQVWREKLAQNKIIEICRKDYFEGRGMCWGKYVL